MRYSLRREIQINRPAADVWSVVGQPELLHHWFPGIVDCHVDGPTRVITTATGHQIPESILTNDAIQRRFQYTITSPLFREHLGTIDVIDLEGDRCLVVYSTDATPAAMAITIAGGTAAALGELRQQMEAGTGPALAARDQLSSAEWASNILEQGA